MLDFSRFFELHSSRGAPFSALPPDHFASSWEQERAIASGDQQLAAPPVFRRNSDREEPEDFGYGGTPAFRLVSHRFTAALRARGCTGWDQQPVVLLDENGSDLGPAALFIVTGRCGPLEHSEVPTDPDRPRWAVGSTFDPASWDGADIFMPDHQTGAILTTKAMNALRDAHLSGVGYLPLTERENWLGGGTKYSSSE